MNLKKKLSIWAVVMFLVLGLGFSSIPPAKAQSQFVLAGWDYPDEYGQGIDFLEIYENSTGSWVKVGESYDHDETIIYDWNVSVAIKIKCWTYFNNTLVGADNTNDGKNYQRHNVTVSNSTGVVFSQNNFTYSNAYDEGDPMWFYVYEVVLNFLPDYGTIYTVTITYEVFY